MSALTFKCPATGRTIDPGIDTDARTVRIVRGVSMRLRCPHCRHDHDFRVAEGVLADAA